jgi:hypothetical protein
MSEIKVIADAFLCGIDAWMDIWGDPLVSGSIFMISYGVTAWLIFRAAREAAKRERWYWQICGALFAFQTLNTNLDLHALIWTTGRCLAHAQGWYEYRKEIQVAFLVGLAILVALILLIVFMVFLRDIFRNFLLTFGVSIAIGFTIVKGISYHDLAQFYGLQVGPFHVADYIEYSGIVLAFIAAIIRLRQIRIASQRQTIRPDLPGNG